MRKENVDKINIDEMARMQENYEQEMRDLAEAHKAQMNEMEGEMKDLRRKLPPTDFWGKIGWLFF